MPETDIWGHFYARNMPPFFGRFSPEVTSSFWGGPSTISTAKIGILTKTVWPSFPLRLNTKNKTKYFMFISHSRHFNKYWYLLDQFLPFRHSNLNIHHSINHSFQHLFRGPFIASIHLVWPPVGPKYQLFPKFWNARRMITPTVGGLNFLQIPHKTLY